MQDDRSIFNFSFDETSKEHIRNISRWAAISAVISLVLLGINLVQFAMMAGGGTRSTFGYRSEAGDSPGSLFIQVIISLLLNITLYSASKQLKKGIDNMSPGMLTRGFGALRNYYKIFGIMVIVALILALLALLFISTYSRN